MTLTENERHLLYDLTAAVIALIRRGNGATDEIALAQRLAVLVTSLRRVEEDWANLPPRRVP